MTQEMGEMAMAADRLRRGCGENTSELVDMCAPLMQRILFGTPWRAVHAHPSFHPLLAGYTAGRIMYVYAVYGIGLLYLYKPSST